MRRFAQGEAAAGQLLLDRYLDRLHASVHRWLQDVGEAEDICQEAFLRLWKQAPIWEPKARVGTWLTTVALNLARDRLRQRGQRELGGLDVDAADSAPGPDQQAAKSQLLAALQAAVGALPERQREAVLLAHVDQFSQAEAAKIMGISEGALESLLVRAKRALREPLAAWRSRGNDEPS